MSEDPAALQPLGTTLTLNDPSPWVNIPKYICRQGFGF